MVLKARVLNDSLVGLAEKPDDTKLEVEVGDTLNESVTVLESSGINNAVEFTAADVDDVEVEVDVDVRLPKRLKDAADDVVELASDEDRLDSVVRLARRLDAEADDELGAAVDTPTLSALIMSAACATCQPT